MWLINTTTLKLESFHECPTNTYAILSHTWGSNAEELTFDEFRAGEGLQKSGFRKIRLCCEQAQRDQLEYAWVDTCCIDKRSSTELSEAINSMFDWYARAKICYVYLADVSCYDPLTLHQSPEGFMNSRWFSRGWTLQELIAPRIISFYTEEWDFIGDKLHLAPYIQEVTGIALSVLESQSDIYKCSLAERFSWASKRKTTRIEDVAYCLLGLFGVSMPLLYGEGSSAFLRLQQVIVDQTDDETIFAWSGVDQGGGGLFAPHPVHFLESATIQQSKEHTQRPSVVKTNRGHQIECQMLPCDMNTYIVPLQCERQIRNSEAQRLAIFLCRTSKDHQYRRVSFNGMCLYAVVDRDMSMAKTSTVFVPQDASMLELMPHAGLPLVKIVSDLNAWHFPRSGNNVINQAPEGAEYTSREAETTTSLSRLPLAPLETRDLETGAMEQHVAEHATDDYPSRLPTLVTQVQFQPHNLKQGIVIAFARSNNTTSTFDYHLEVGFDMDFRPICILHTMQFQLVRNDVFSRILRNKRVTGRMILGFSTLLVFILPIIINAGSKPAALNWSATSVVPFTSMMLWFLYLSIWTTYPLPLFESFWENKKCERNNWEAKNLASSTKRCTTCHVVTPSSLKVMSTWRTSRRGVPDARDQHHWTFIGNRTKGFEVRARGQLPRSYGCMDLNFNFQFVRGLVWQLTLLEEPLHSKPRWHGMLCWHCMWQSIIGGFSGFLKALFILLTLVMLESSVVFMSVGAPASYWIPKLVDVIGLQPVVALCASILLSPLIYMAIIVLYVSIRNLRRHGAQMKERQKRGRKEEEGLGPCEVTGREVLRL